MDVFASLAHEDEAEQSAAANARAVEAAKVRTAHQFGSYIALAKTQELFEARVNMVEERAVSLAKAVAAEYGSDDLDQVVEAVSEALHTAGGHKGDCGCGFCKNKGKGFGPKDDEKTDESDDDKDDSKDDDKDENPFGKDSHATMRESLWHEAAGEPETGDNYDSERVDLPAAGESGLGDTGSVPTDKSKVPAGGLKPVDVPSTRNRVEQQSVSEGDGYGTYSTGDPNPDSPLRKQVDADTALQPEHNVADHTDTWNGMAGLAEAVTSKWRVAT